MWKKRWGRWYNARSTQICSIDEIVLDIINKSYRNSEQHDLWNISNIVPVLKSGYLTKADNYRGISLTSIMVKTYTRMILNRIRPVLDPLLRPNQNGFRQKRTTVGQILAIRRILEGIKDTNLPAFLHLLTSRRHLTLYIEVRWLKYIDHMEYLISLSM